MDGEIKKTGPPAKNLVNRLNKAFETENVLSAPPMGLTDALNDPTSQTDAFGASRKLLGSPNKSKNPVRNALDEAALKLSSVGTSLQDMTPRALRAAGDDEWTLSTENPVFSEVNTPREHIQNTSAKNTPAKERNMTSPTRSTPRTARTPGSAQKEDATVFPRSFPVKEPAGGYGLRGGLAGWMRKSSKVQKNEETHLATSSASSDTGDFRGTSSGGLGEVIFMFLALFLVVGVLFLVPTNSLPSSVAVYLEKFRHEAATSPTGSTNLVSLVSNKEPQSIPRLTSTNFPLSDLRYRAASTLRHFSSDSNAVQEYKTVRQIAITVFEAPLKVMGSAIGGVCLAVVMVAAVLQLHGVMPLSALATILGSSSKGGGGGAATAGGLGDGFYNENNMDLIEEEQQHATRGRRGSTARKTSTRRASGATPSFTRRLVSDDAEGGGRVSSARKSWKRQDTA